MSVGFSDSSFIAEARDSSVLRILWIGNAGPHKNLAELVESVAIVEGTTGQTVEVSVAGNFLKANREQFESMARSTGLLSPLAFLGYLDRDELRSAYLRSTAYVSTSRLESFDNGVLEALALGIPVVATDIPARDSARSVIYTYPSGAASQLASLLVTLLSDSDQRVEMSKSGRRYANALT